MCYVVVCDGWLSIIERDAEDLLVNCSGHRRLGHTEYVREQCIVNGAFEKCAISMLILYYASHNHVGTANP